MTDNRMRSEPLTNAELEARRRELEAKLRELEACGCIKEMPDRYRIRPGGKGSQVIQINRRDGKT